MHVRLLKSHFDIVTVEEWVRCAAIHEPLPARACALTFDDGWRDNFEHAFPVLRSERVPATMYVVTDLVGSEYEFWPNRIARLLAGRNGSGCKSWPTWLANEVSEVTNSPEKYQPLSIAEIDLVITRCKSRYTDDSMLSMLGRIETNEASSSDTDNRNLLSWDEIRTLADSGIFQFGSHTRHHTRLDSRVASHVLQDEICESRRILESHLGKRATSFCYPNGDFCSPALELVRTSYSAAVTTRNGVNSQNTDRHLLKRVGIHEAAASTKPAFLSWLARAYIH